MFVLIGTSLYTNLSLLSAVDSVVESTNSLSQNMESCFDDQDAVFKDGFNTIHESTDRILCNLEETDNKI